MLWSLLWATAASHQHTSPLSRRCLQVCTLELQAALGLSKKQGNAGEDEDGGGGEAGDGEEEKGC